VKFKFPVADNPIYIAALFLFIDGLGVGIILPVLPRLLSELSGAPINVAAQWGGVMTFLYAAMQFCFSSMIGSLSDKFGRRPVIIVSMTALAIDYVVMALAPTLLVLLVARLLTGIAGANQATASAIVADVSDSDARASRFGLLAAAFGSGLVFGPALGGVLGQLGTSAPFWMAAGVAAIGALLSIFTFRETLKPENRRPFSLRRSNPAGAFAQLSRFGRVRLLLIALFLGFCSVYVYPTIWSFFAELVYGWSSFQVGLSLTAYGLLHATLQVWGIPRIERRIGRKGLLVLAHLSAVTAMIAVGLTTSGIVACLMIPLAALGGLATPTYLALLADRIPQNAQGELHGAVATLNAAAAITSPIGLSQVFGILAVSNGALLLPGAPFLIAALLVALALTTAMIALKPRT